MDYFVVVAPATRHTNTGLACDRASFHARCWCRAEISGCWARNGSSKMYISTDHGIDKLFPGGEDDPQLREAIDVFGGNLTSALCGNQISGAPRLDATCFLTHCMISTQVLQAGPSRRDAL